MGSGEPDNRTWRYYLRRLLTGFPFELLPLFVDVAQDIARWIGDRYAGPYEILDYDAVVELIDETGTLALFKKRQRVKFLQNSIIAIEDYAWGDGDILADYKCTPGVVVDKYRQGDRWNILISLRDTKSIGDIEQFHIERTVKDAYTRDEEWLQTEIRRHTRRLKMSVIFPQNRHCQHAVLIQRSASRVTELGPEHVDNLPDGRQIVFWETTHAKGFDVYTLKWRW